MAERRMFAKTIIDSDAFLDMPLSTQALYFHLAMRADDDGFVNNPKKILRMIGCSDDDYKLLRAKQFIITFDIGVIVIRHWRIHNYIQTDRYKPTIYQNEKSQLVIGKDRVYSLDTECIQNVSELEANCIHDGADLDTQVRLDKVSLVKDREYNNSENGTGLSTEIFELSTAKPLIENILLNHWHRKATDDDIKEAVGQLKRLNNDLTLLETALSIAAQYGERTCNWSYIKSIIKSWLEKGYQTEEDIIMHELNRKSEAYLKHQNRMEMER